MMKLPTVVVFLACLLLLQQQAAAAGVDAWRSQVIYFLLTDRFAPSPGVKPGPCSLHDWNNGTWKGITQNLDLLKDMGMTAVWITPIPYQYRGKTFGEAAYHGYWAEDWTQIEPRYGTEQDLKDLIAAAHKKGMLTMLDIVGNHAIPTDGNYSSIKPFNKPEHYHSCSGCTEHCAIPDTAYASAEAWPPREPEADLVKQCRLVNLADLNQTHPFVRQGLISWVKGTLKKYPFDAIRMDTVKHVQTDFWTDFTHAVDVFSMGEVLHGNTRVMPQYLQKGPDGRAPMDSVLNFPMYYKLTDVFAYQQDMRALSWERKLQNEVIGADKISVLGNFLDNHDFPRFLELQPDHALFKNGLAWVLLAEGIPVIYYGSAAGMRGGTEGNRHRECLWDRPYDTQSDLYRIIGTLSKLRTSRKLWNITERHENVTEDCYSYTLGADTLVVLTNRGSNLGNATKTCSITLPANSQLLRKGLTGVQDVLDFQQDNASPPQGATWDAASRTLTVKTPGGNPRVFTSNRLTPSFSTNTTRTEILQSTKPVYEQDNVRINWGRAPELFEAGKSSGAGAASAHVFLVAVAATVAAVLAGVL